MPFGMNIEPAFGVGCKIGPYTVLDVLREPCVKNGQTFMEIMYKIADASEASCEIFVSGQWLQQKFIDEQGK